MRRITIHLFVAILTFTAGITVSTLLNGLRSLFIEEAEKPTVSVTFETPPAPPQPQSAETFSSSCLCQTFDGSGLDTTPPSTNRQIAPIRGGILNGKAISLPKPPYPPIAKAAHASGTVVVQIIVDERGCVISAQAVSGHPLLQQAAVQAAHHACFPPTRLSGQPVKISGILTYNFVLS
jgi:TonB family protein